MKIGDSATATEDRGYTYDTAWNLSFLTNNGTYPYTVDGKSQLTSYQEGNATYDDNGNLSSLVDGFGTFTYDDENQLVQVDLTEWLRSQFVYDGRGRLRQSTEFSWNSAGSATSVQQGVSPAEQHICRSTGFAGSADSRHADQLKFT